LDQKDKIVVEDKLIILQVCAFSCFHVSVIAPKLGLSTTPQGIEEALKILFPNCEIEGENMDIMWDGLSEEGSEDEEFDDSGAVSGDFSDEEESHDEKGKKVRPKMRVNPKTGESEVQADMDLERVPALTFSLSGIVSNCSLAWLTGRRGTIGRL